MRKAQSISINTVIVAAIALIVLVVIIAIFGGRMKIVTGGVRACSTQGTGAHCAAPPCESNEVNVPGTECEDLAAKPNCCIELFAKKK